MGESISKKTESPPPRLSPIQAVNQVGANPDPGGPEGPEQVVEEIQAARQKFQQTYQAINQANPLSSDFSLTGAPVLEGPLGKVQEVLRSPVVQSYVGFISKPQVQSKFSELTKHPQTQNLLYTELGFFIVFLILKTWWTSGMSSFFSRLLLKTALWILYLALAGFVLPWYFWGKRFFEVFDIIFN